MKIKDIVKITATSLGREDVYNYLNSSETTANQEVALAVDLLVRLTNLVISELSSTYIPVVKIEPINAKNGKVYYAELSERALKIKRVLDSIGNSVEFTVDVEYFTVKGNAKQVEYEYLPSNYGLEEEIGYTEKDLPIRVLSYGVCAEYCICEGQFNQAVMWHKRYADGVAEICLPKSKRIKERSWL